MSKIPQTVLAAGAAMFSPYVPELTSGRLEQILKQVSGPAKLEPGLTPKEFCKLAKIHRQTLWNMEKRKEIKVVRFGHSVRVPQSEVERILNIPAE
jgi:excisionase family DNA binding protein